MENRTNITRNAYYYRLCSQESFYSENHTFNVYSDCSLAGISVIIAVVLVIITIAILGNILVATVICLNKCYWNTYGYCRLYIAVIDVLVGTAYLPFRIWTYISVLFINQDGNLESIIKQHETDYWGVLVVMSCITATYIIVIPSTLLVLTIDRFAAIVHPYIYKKNSRKLLPVGLVATALIGIFGGILWTLIFPNTFIPSVLNRQVYFDSKLDHSFTTSNAWFTVCIIVLRYIYA
ncbi:uncharacterized protein LOC108949312 [Ciona intestinalis]